MNRLCRSLVTASLLLLSLSRPVLGGGGPLGTFVVVNPDSPESLRIANEYIDVRQIPSSNVMYKSWSPVRWQIWGKDFRDNFLRPILAELDARKLGGQIDLIVYSSHFPTYVDFRDIYKSSEPRSPNLPVASLTSATYLYQFILGDRREFTALNTNFYFDPIAEGVASSKAFHNAIAWEPGAKRGEKGLRYLMAAMLSAAVPGEPMPLEEVVRTLRRSAQADGTRPKGTFFFMDNGSDPRSLARKNGFAAAVAELTAMGQQAVISRGAVPQGQRAVLGVTTGAPQVPLAGSSSTLLPGALVDNLTSHGAFFAPNRNAGSQTLVTEYQRLGAAAASGTVVEPFAIQAKFPTPTLHVHYARGCSAAEAFYQSVQGPFQLLVLGDPLCQPFATIGKVDPALPGTPATLTGKVELKPRVVYPAGGGAARQFELFIDGVRVAAAGPNQPLPLDTAKLGDGYHRVDVVAIDASLLEMQSRWTDWVSVKNGRDALQLSRRADLDTSDSIAVQAACTRDAPIDLFHNGRKVGHLDNRNGTAEILKKQLGTGPVSLEARTADDPRLYARPLKIQVN